MNTEQIVFVARLPQSSASGVRKTQSKLTAFIDLQKEESDTLIMTVVFTLSRLLRSMGCSYDAGEAKEGLANEL